MKNIPLQTSSFRRSKQTSILILLSLIIPSAVADSMRARCGYSNAAEVRPESTESCTFSQRQGYISVDIDGGERIELSPVGDAPGNFRDGDGNAVYRQRGLGDEGQLFRLSGRYLFVLWQPDLWSCPAGTLSGDNGCTLRHGSLSFHLATSGTGSITRLWVSPSGLTEVNEVVEEELDGNAYGSELADLDANGWPEIYVYVSSAGSGSYGSLVAYAVNNGKSMTPIYLPPRDQTPEVWTGYMGHDEFAVVENRLVRRFPLYNEGDTNSAPSGGTRQLQYRLEAGEAGWVLVVDKVVDY
jgi:hypothetical protein